MATTQRYFPSAEPDQIPWCNNYSAKLLEHGLSMGELQADIDAAVADMAYYVWIIGTYAPSVVEDGKQATAYKARMARGTGPDELAFPPGSLFTDGVPAAVKPGILTRTFAQVGRMKKDKGYTEEKGTDLGIIGSEDTTEHLFPEFKLTVEDGQTCQCVKIDFKKFGHQAVRFETRRNNGAWELLDILTTSPRRDARALLVAGQGEVREYRARFWDHDAPGGDWSPVQKATVGP